MSDNAVVEIVEEETRRPKPATAVDPDRILKLRQAAAEAGCSVDTLRREHKAGRLAFIRISAGLYGVRRRDVLKL